ncbi:hypothetical protein VOM14_29670 [Paraburkholderia sp. MPAMCS5]|uniref:hypothetical protein n=1 Tax=Paraburkholderia sp. MPAMCS5 TaxID=3112563 RepID=UPI002E19AF1E|nr:hypothetical protein [Paraburkholderia sp. MPAMCS5]
MKNEPCAAAVVPACPIGASYVFYIEWSINKNSIAPAMSVPAKPMSRSMQVVARSGRYAR